MLMGHIVPVDPKQAEKPDRNGAKTGKKPPAKAEADKSLSGKVLDGVGAVIQYMFIPAAGVVPSCTSQAPSCLMFNPDITDGKGNTITGGLSSELSTKGVAEIPFRFEIVSKIRNDGSGWGSVKVNGGISIGLHDGYVGFNKDGDFYVKEDGGPFTSCNTAVDDNNLDDLGQCSPFVLQDGDEKPTYISGAYPAAIPLMVDGYPVLTSLDGSGNATYRPIQVTAPELGIFNSNVFKLSADNGGIHFVVFGSKIENEMIVTAYYYIKGFVSVDDFTNPDTVLLGEDLADVLKKDGGAIYSALIEEGYISNDGTDEITTKFTGDFEDFSLPSEQYSFSQDQIQAAFIVMRYALENGNIVGPFDINENDINTEDTFNAYYKTDDKGVLLSEDSHTEVAAHIYSYTKDPKYTSKDIYYGNEDKGLTGVLVNNGVINPESIATIVVPLNYELTLRNSETGRIQEVKGKIEKGTQGISFIFDSALLDSAEGSDYTIIDGSIRLELAKNAPKGFSLNVSVNGIMVEVEQREEEGVCEKQQ
ncbi:hypothetical protein A2230_00120 [candidate division WOR-1 bacterium RIFOXYA2_FULL_36_21]|uniref:Uncharacterized protein n=1 Tax=candidate division WOR-1 bacterium RIFOXYB2_FULL_36_35 TaxID=1802578 RepID=A0A1F4S010_UNCSA|nr:MAG: hypothetical protein A2230_00120 [candidate division WOR-1 bacterium RIFOXYA2_FULL_36_21]OGC13762.1 MAG: hypothetical protein A2290_07810 [candidate division WOR-1 bacterium RIFOXYB2_FULL_36_35]OGC14485.1 MAG: hypothetical protein A2282_08810 [candidate division WOR-1 bacterium RIFOXYA12_FULL_36_13]